MKYHDEKDYAEAEAIQRAFREQDANGGEKLSKEGHYGWLCGFGDHCLSVAL